MKHTLLTKSKFLEYLQCTERLHKSLSNAGTMDDATKHVLENGNQVGLLARELFPTGVEVGRFSVTDNLLSSISKTENKVFFEATFATTELLARCDVLSLMPDNSLKISEVKSTTTYKPTEHLADLCFQKRVVEEATGLDVSEMELIHINPDYEFDGVWNIHDYFIVETVLLQEEIQDEIYKKIDECLNHIQTGFPAHSRGPHCKKPYICPHYNICNNPLETILTLRRGSGKSWSFLSQGIKRISEVDDVSLLSPFQLKQYESEKYEKPIIDRPKIKAFLNGIKYPCSFLDFEGFATPIIHELGLLNVKPYSQIVFQAELKISKAKESDELEEAGVIAIPGIDPRRQVAEFLNKSVPDSGSIVVYFKNYEVSRIKELILLFPEYKKKFTSMIDRIVDLEEVFSKGLYVDCNFKGSTSVKEVLGVVCEDMANAYKDVGSINNGQLASIRYLEYFNGYLSSKERNQLLDSLKKYCSLDVYSLWRIVKQLRRICGEE